MHFGAVGIEASCHDWLQNGSGRDRGRGGGGGGAAWRRDRSRRDLDGLL